MVVRDGTDHHRNILVYLEGEKLCCGVLVLKVSEKYWDVDTLVVRSMADN
jgi:hypothetical protein